MDVNIFGWSHLQGVILTFGDSRTKLIDQKRELGRRRLDCPEIGVQRLAKSTFLYIWHCFTIIGLDIPYIRSIWDMLGIVIDSDASAICISVLRSFSWHHGIRSNGGSKLMQHMNILNNKCRFLRNPPTQYK